jgi:hypothetical protein
LTVILHSLFFSVFPIDDKTESPSFGTVEVIVEESQAVLNTLTEYYFQDAFKNSIIPGKGDGGE